MNHTYSALVVEARGARWFELEFPSNPTLREVLDDLHKAMTNHESVLMKMVQQSAHASGVADELFNESLIFRFKKADSEWLHVCCPQHLCNVQMQTKS